MSARTALTTSQGAPQMTGQSHCCSESSIVGHVLTQRDVYWLSSELPFVTCALDRPAVPALWVSTVELRRLEPINWPVAMADSQSVSQSVPSTLQGGGGCRAVRTALQHQLRLVQSWVMVGRAERALRRAAGQLIPRKTVRPSPSASPSRSPAGVVPIALNLVWEEEALNHTGKDWMPPSPRSSRGTFWLSSRRHIN